MSEIKIIEKKEVFKDYITINKAKLEIAGHPFERICINSTPSVAAFLFDSKKDKVVLLNQYRYPINDYILEIPAGHVDKNETLKRAISREVGEEVGVKIDENKFMKLCEYYPMIGNCDEKITIYFCPINVDEIKNENRIPDLENSMSEIKIIDYNEFQHMIIDGKIVDGKTLLAHLYSAFLMNK